MTTSQAIHIATLLIPIVVPLILAAESKLLAKIPSTWKPFVAGIIGPIIALVTSAISHVNLNADEIAFIGLSGVGVREMVDQLKKSVGASDPVVTAPVQSPPKPPAVM